MEDFVRIAEANWQDMTHFARMNFLRSLRLHIIAEKKREEREQALKEYFLEQWLKENP